MISAAEFKRQRRRLAIARGRFNRARQALPANPYSNEADPQALPAAIDAAAKLEAAAIGGLDLFAEVGYPDSWANWESAQRDAAAFLNRWEERCI